MGLRGNLWEPDRLRLICDPGCEVWWSVGETTCIPTPKTHRVFVPWRFKESERAELEGLLKAWLTHFDTLPLDQLAGRHAELVQVLGRSLRQSRLFLQRFAGTEDE